MVDELENATMIDHNLVLGALSEMDFKYNTIVIPSHESVRIMPTAGKSEICDKDIDTHYERIRRLFTVREVVILIVSEHTFHEITIFIFKTLFRQIE